MGKIEHVVSWERRSLRGVRRYAHFYDTQAQAEEKARKLLADPKVVACQIRKQEDNSTAKTLRVTVLDWKYLR